MVLNQNGRHLDKNKLWFKFYMPSNLGLVNVYKKTVIVIAKDTKENNTRQSNCDKKVSHIVVDFSNRDGESSMIYTANI